MKEAMSVFDSFKKTSHENISLMKNHQRILYGLVVGTRFSPFYESFSIANSFGKSATLREVREVALRAAGGETINYEMIGQLRQEIESLIPDSDDFVECSNAMDAGLIHLYILQYLLEGKSENIEHISGIVYDLLDRSAQDALEIEGIDRATERQIESHDIVSMNVEVEYQIQRSILGMNSSTEEARRVVDLWNMKYIKIEEKTKI